jgi:hypothetical protein
MLPITGRPKARRASFGASDVPASAVAVSGVLLLAIVAVVMLAFR